MPSGSRFTIDDVPPVRFHYRIAALTGGGKFIDGYTLGILTIALAVLPPDFGMTPFYAGLVGSAALVGLFLGSLLLGPLADRIGRRTLYTADLVLFFVASLAQLLVQDPVQLFVLRLVLGIAIGIDYAVGPTYLSEVLPKKLRGPLLGGLSAVWRFGFLASIVVGYVLSDLGPGAWKWILATSAVPAAVVMVFRLGVPESPRWLVQQGRYDEADAVVKKWLSPDAGVDDLVRAHESATGPRRSNLANLKALFSRQWRSRTLYAGFFWIAQATPQTAIFTFLPSLFVALGLAGGLTPTLVQNAFFAVGGIVGMVVVNLVTRRTMLVSTFWLMAVSVAALAVVPEPGAVVVVTCLCTYAFIEAIAGNLQFVYPSELFPTSLRAAGVGTAAALSRIGAAVGTFLFPIVLATFGVQALVFGTVCLLVLGAVVSQQVAPETSGRGLDETAAEREAPLPRDVHDRR